MSDRTLFFVAMLTFSIVVLSVSTSRPAGHISELRYEQMDR
jgi:hypothetical protein